MFVVVSVSVRNGAPAGCTTVGKAQKPPVTDCCPLVIGLPARGIRLANRTAHGLNTPGARIAATLHGEPISE